MQPPFRFQQFLAPRHWPTWVTLGALRLCLLLPLSWQQAIGAGLGTLTYYLHRPRRRIARTNIDLCFPDMPPRERSALVRETFRETGIGVLATPLAWWCDSQWLRERSSVEGLEHLLAALARGKGAILLTGHSTSLEVGGRVLTLHVPMQAMYRKIRNKLIDALAVRARAKHVKGIIRRNNPRDFLRGLAENLPTWYAPDQDFGRKGTVFAPFMGAPAATLLATARLARASGAPVVPFYPYRLPRGRGYRVVIQPPLDGFPADDPQADAARINAVLEAQVRLAPAQYMWVHRRFKTRPPGAPPVY